MRSDPIVGVERRGAMSPADGEALGYLPSP